MSDINFQNIPSPLFPSETYVNSALSGTSLDYEWNGSVEGVELGSVL